MIIGILDYGAGNLKNVCRAVNHLGYEYQLVSTKEELACVDKLILPGVGAFKIAMEQLSKLSLIAPLQELANKGTPILGICLGMQLLFDCSDEFGYTKGLSLLKGEIALIPSVNEEDIKLKVPHIGWNELVLNKSNKITTNIKNNDAVYFIHSYRLVNFDPADIVATCSYEGVIIPSIVQHKNIIGCQFHPEKSATVGLSILNNFLT